MERKRIHSAPASQRIGWPERYEYVVIAGVEREETFHQALAVTAHAAARTARPADAPLVARAETCPDR